MSLRITAAAVAASAFLVACGTDGPIGGGSPQPQPASSQVTTVVVSPLTSLATVGDTLRLAASTRDTSGTPLLGRVVAWSSEAPSIAIVSATGLVTAMSAGSVRISALSEGRSGTATITITR
jgi:uncharacterized protein YjdB